MNVMKAMEQTVKLAYDRGMGGGPVTPNLSGYPKTESTLGYPHIAGMLIRMQEGNFSYGKLCRWLGWAQAAVVASGCATLEDMKVINLSNKTDAQKAPTPPTPSVHLDMAEQRKDVLDYQVANCPTCNTRLQEGFGLAGGGYGPYGYCEECNRVVWKCQLPEE